MFFFRKFAVYAAVSIGLMLMGISAGNAERIDRGSQVIDGTRMNTTIYHERGYAVFENDCGSQRLSQRELQNGAKPTDIIPCPRPRSQTESPAQDSGTFTGKRLWAAVAAGIDNGFLGVGSRVSVGFGKDYATRAEAERAAVRTCQKKVSSCRVVTAWNAGCYYITVSDNAQNVAWGAGPSAQEAYNQCYKRVQGGNCKTQTLGGCYPR